MFLRGIVLVLVTMTRVKRKEARGHFITKIAQRLQMSYIIIET